MDAGVDQHAAPPALQRPPGRVVHQRVAAAERHVHHHPRLADHAVVEQGLREPAQRVASVVFRHRQRHARRSGRVAHPPGRLHRYADRLFGHHMHARGEGSLGKHMVHPRVRDDVDGVKRLGRQHGVEIRVDSGPFAKMFPGHVRHMPRGLIVDIADGDQAERIELLAMLDQAMEMPEAHASAADERDVQCHLL